MDQTDGWEGWRTFRVQRKTFEDSSRSVCSLYLVPTDGQTLPSFAPGQFLTFSFRITDPVTQQPKAVTRCYSLSDQPGLDYYRISVKRVPAPAGSVGIPPGLASHHIHDTIQEGDILQVKAPSGQFCLEKGAFPVVFVAGGIGITPLLSMLNTHLAQGPTREIWLFYGVRNSTEQVSLAHLKALARQYPHFHLQVCYSKPLPGDIQDSDCQQAGHVDIALLRRTLSLPLYQFYVCGPRNMMESIIPALDAEGIPEAWIHFESFGPASLVRPGRSSTTRPEQAASSAAGRGMITVTFVRSGKTLPWDEKADSLLEFAEQNGIEVASGCRSGGCGTCETIIQQGEVAYTYSPDFSPQPGSGLLCVAKPKRELSLMA
ncbi:MAG: 2Fe-2S iron-sulfur cluster binding domain-containing protein [Magnetococcales bacterium]|nr:2Fe-2S iron-sulfur cluster binding domain-containing protein [Magnetococcales bacterium]